MRERHIELLNNLDLSHFPAFMNPHFAARKALQFIIAVELMCAAQGLDFLPYESLLWSTRTSILLSQCCSSAAHAPRLAT